MYILLLDADKFIHIPPFFLEIDEMKSLILTLHLGPCKPLIDLMFWELLVLGSMMDLGHVWTDDSES